MGDTASAVGSMLLFVLFAVCMLMAVAVAADTYSRIKTGYQQSFGTAASIKYISNKLRAAENVTLLEDGSAAAIESAGTVSVRRPLAQTGSVRRILPMRAPFSPWQNLAKKFMNQTRGKRLPRGFRGVVPGTSGGHASP